MRTFTTSQLQRIGCRDPARAHTVLGGSCWSGRRLDHAKAVLAQILLERAFGETLATGQAVKPWSWADTWPVARVAVPRIGASAIVLAGAAGRRWRSGPATSSARRSPASRHRGLFRPSRHALRLPRRRRVGDEIRVTRRDGATSASASAARGGALGRLGHRPGGRRPSAGAGHLLAARCDRPGPLRYVVHAEMVDEEPVVRPARNEGS